MTLLNPIAAIIYLVHLGINIAMLFVIIRLILTWKYFAWLARFDKVGKPLVDNLTISIGHFFYTKWKRRLSENGKLLICLMLLSITQVILTAFFNLCVQGSR